jgi:hypothetical protein
MRSFGVGGIRRPMIFIYILERTIFIKLHIEFALMNVFTKSFMHVHVQ